MRAGIPHAQRKGLPGWGKPAGSRCDAHRSIPVLRLHLEYDRFAAGVHAEVVMRERQIVDFRDVVPSRLEENARPIERLDRRGALCITHRDDATLRAPIEQRYDTPHSRGHSTLL